MQLRVIHWNIKMYCDIIKIIEYIKPQIKNNSIINLQEVTIESFTKIKDFLDEKSICSLNYRKPGIYEGNNRKIGVVTLVYGGDIHKSSLLRTSVFPERSLITVIDFNGFYITNFTFHSLTGCDYKKAKSSNFASIASFLATNKIDIFSCDANEPKIDSLDEDLVECFDNRDNGKNASYLFGKNRIHSLVDSYKWYANKKSLKLESGYTHITGGKMKRYDFIYGNPNWKIKSSKTSYNDSIAASSDHSILITDYLVNEEDV